MKYTFGKIIIILNLILTVLLIIGLLGITKVKIQSQIYFGFAIWMLFSYTVLFINLIKLSHDQPKQTVRIIYKEPESKEQKEPKNKEKEDKQKKINNYVNIVTSNLNNISDIEQFSDQLFKNLAKAFDIVTGMLFLWDEKDKKLKTKGLYAFYQEETYKEYKLGEGITGQVAKDKKILYIDNVPKGYIVVLSGLGKGTPRYLTFLPVVYNDKTISVIEFANFSALPEPTIEILQAIGNALAPIMKKFVE